MVALMFESTIFCLLNPCFFQYTDVVEKVCCVALLKFLVMGTFSWPESLYFLIF